MFCLSNRIPNRGPWQPSEITHKIIVTYTTSLSFVPHSLTTSLSFVPHSHTHTQLVSRIKLGCWSVSFLVKDPTDRTHSCHYSASPGLAQSGKYYVSNRICLPNSPGSNLGWRTFLFLSSYLGFKTTWRETT